MEYKYNIKQLNPCGNCPYRKDAPKTLWHKTEFKRLLKNQKDIVGKVYGCHKKNESICVGWAILQVKNGVQCNALRIEMLRGKLTYDYLESLSSPQAELYDSLEDMIKHNFPELLKL